MTSTQQGDPIPFSLAEYHRRLERARQRMRERGLRALVCNEPENIYYLTGYKTIGYYWYQAVIVTEDHDPVVVLRKFEESNVLFGTWSKQLAPYMDYDDPVETTVKALADLGVPANATIGLEERNWFLTVKSFKGFQRLLPNATFVDSTDVVEQLRAVKSEEELAYTRRSARIASQAAIDGIEAVREGRTERDLAVAVWTSLIQNGSEEPAIVPFILSGERTYLAHQTWADRTLQKGDVVYYEIAARSSMYHAAQMRCATIGQPSDEVRRLADATIGALDAAIPKMKPGAISQDVDRAAREVIEKAGFGEYFRHRLAYSIGIKYPPDWGEGHIISLKPHDESVLEAGMVFHLVPLCLVYGKYGVGFSETVLVTEKGGEPLTSAPRELAVR